MAVYNKNGEPLATIYGKDGTPLNVAYDKNGNVIYTASTFKVMSYNVGQWYIGNGYAVPTDKKSEYHTLQANTLANNPVDVLLIQEYLNEWCVDGSLASEFISPYFDYQNTTTPQGYIGHSTCTKVPQSNYTSHPFTSHGANYPSFESCEIVVDGKTITLINTHLDYSSAYQPSEIADLVNFVENLDYFIICGDFNCGAEAVGDSQYNVCIKPFVDKGYHASNCNGDNWINTYYATADPEGTRYKTDNIITSANISIVNVYAYTEKLTDGIADKIDHIPLIAELSIL